MIDQHPRQKLGFFPTPLAFLPRLTAALGGPRIFIKRDDQTGLALGGNKTRKLEFLIAEAKANGCDTLITAGAAQSNHCRQTAAAAAVCGLECHLVLGGQPAEAADGNLLLDRLLGAQIHFTEGERKGERLEQLAEELRRAGKNPFVIPYGGSNAAGALGYVAAVGELGRQVSQLGLAQMYIVMASSSGGSQAGATVGLHLNRISAKIVGIGIDKGEAGTAPYEEFLAELANLTAEKLGMASDFGPHDFLVRHEYYGAGYGVVGDAEREAIALTAQTEGILLDPVYTGRAMGALVSLIRAKELVAGDNVIFWHSGGTPALFPYRESLLQGHAT